MANITVSPETRARLQDIGKMNETYDQVIVRLIDGRKIQTPPVADMLIGDAE